MAAGTAALAALVAVAASLYVHVLNDFGPLDIYAPPQVVNTSAEELFSDSYYHARALFRTHVEAAELTLFTLPLDGYAHLDLTIDVAVVEGAKDRVLLHVSGTHGVEGFAGSAIQSALLTRRKQASAGKSKVETQQPTVIFVHALNPYGFSQLRRFNEHNVDLNRNWLTPEQFNAFAAQDPNTNGYMDLYDTLNPSSIGGALDSFWVKAAYHVATKGFTAVKRTLVSSNYRFPNATYYGGDKLEPSLVLLRDFLKQHVDLDGVKAFGMIDVHTGLGPAGVDTLLLGWPSSANKVARIFGGIEKLTPVHGGDANNDVSGGYETTAGFILDGVAALLPSASHKNNVLLAQEFGTVPGVFIVKAGVDEAFVYRNARGRRLPYAEKLRDVFYLHRSASWKAAVVQRGVVVFDQVYEHIATCAFHFHKRRAHQSRIPSFAAKCTLPTPFLMALVSASLAVAVAAALLALVLHALHDFAPMDTYFPPPLTNASAKVESHFTETYYDARTLFRSRARQVPGAKLYTLPLPRFEDDDLSIDVALVQGSSERVLVHISGTHGVEGFAGSAIQSALLQRLAAEEARADSPTLVFVHALNPYGFAKLRRFNENNVDLNRNFLTPAEFQQRIAMDPNAYGYVDMLEVINPSSPVSWTTLPKTLYGIVQGEMTHGKGATKRAAVCGNYHFPKTIFYGGVEQQASGALLLQFLSEHLDFKQLKQVGVIDVHTGLGPPGFDTLILDVSAERDHAEKIFAGGNVAINGEVDDEAAKGYDGVAGLLCSGMSWFLPTHVQSVCLTQEFGTAPGLVVMKALIEENAMFHYAPSRRLPYAQKLRDAFYLHRSYQWKSDLIERGLRVFGQLQSHVASVA